MDVGLIFRFFTFLHAFIKAVLDSYVISYINFPSMLDCIFRRFSNASILSEGKHNNVERPESKHLECVTF